MVVTACQTSQIDLRLTELYKQYASRSKTLHSMLWIDMLPTPIVKLEKEESSAILA